MEMFKLNEWLKKYSPSTQNFWSSRVNQKSKQPSYAFKKVEKPGKEAQDGCSKIMNNFCKL